MQTDLVKELLRYATKLEIKADGTTEVFLSRPDLSIDGESKPRPEKPRGINGRYLKENGRRKNSPGFWQEAVPRLALLYGTLGEWGGIKGRKFTRKQMLGWIKTDYPAFVSNQGGIKAYLSKQGPTVGIIRIGNGEYILQSS